MLTLGTYGITNYFVLNKIFRQLWKDCCFSVRTGTIVNRNIACWCLQMYVRVIVCIRMFCMIITWHVLAKIYILVLYYIPPNTVIPWWAAFLASGRPQYTTYVLHRLKPILHINLAQVCALERNTPGADPWSFEIDGCRWMCIGLGRNKFPRTQSQGVYL